ncbi:MAG TPA: kynureninase [Chloroflexus aurantiacus]|uniref:Kynureninase n=2 Tax=Chloroflexus aurantiacus TaxID=1108 RepID=A9WK35_CHLAA|nr:MULTISPECIES: kynureninase [Chloroflexus]ABY34486.1 aminotransferase class V [Chloroflexus aurantiacus J-10-fl]HBW66571.1 kynureninase [Chloroflexus aurantiacus]
MMTVPLDRSYADQLDAADDLAGMQQAFVNLEPDMIYLDGNSLGRLPRAAVDLADDLVRRQWGERLIRGWNEGWFDLPERIGAKIARLIGAAPDEVIVADSTSVNLFKLVVAALRAQRGRMRIISDDLNFPSDLYILQGVVDLLGSGHEIALAYSADGIHGPVETILSLLDHNTALLTLSHVTFKSGFLYDMKALTAAAHAVGALTIWDLSHSVGAVPIDLNGSGVDLAVGCCYKYLNGGPGAPAFLYIRRDLQERLINPISGWMGQRDLFNFDLDYAPTAGLRRFLTGTPPIMSLALIEPGVDLILAAGIERLRAKSIAQTEYLIELWQQRLAPLGYTLNSPRDPARRGSHVSLGHPAGLGIDLALINELNVLPDFRAPDNIRLGITPLYTSFRDIYIAVERLAQAVIEQRYLKYQSNRPTVT